MIYGYSWVSNNGIFLSDSNNNNCEKEFKFLYLSFELKNDLWL